MEVRHLELLRELSVRGSLTAVAEATHRTASALSQQLRSAERELGVKLVEPHSRGIRLTAQGQLLAEGADAVLGPIARLRADLDASIGEPRGLVRIGTLPSAGEALLPQLVVALRDTAIQLDIDDFDLAEADFAARTLDADIVIGHSVTGDVPAGAENLVSRVIAREPLDVALPADHPLASKAALSPADLRNTRWLGVPEGYPFDTVMGLIEAAIDAPLERIVRLRDNRLVESLVATDEGLALLPRFSTRPNPAVALRPLEGVRAVRNIVALARPDRYARLAVRTVIEDLVTIGNALSTVRRR